MSTILPSASVLTLAIRRVIASGVAFSLLGPAVAGATALPGAGTLDNLERQNPTVPRSASALAVPDIILPDTGASVVSGQAEAGAMLFTLQKVKVTGEMRGGASTPPLAIKKATRTAKEISAPLLGQPVSLKDIRDLADRMSLAFRENGIILARVIVPPQTVRDGELELQIIPGQFDGVTLQNAAPVRDDILTRMARAAAPEGGIITREKLERLSLLLSEIPGVKGEVALTAGEKTGTASLSVTTREAQRFTGYIGTDNHGTPTIGRGRLYMGGDAAGLIKAGDQLRFDGSVGYENGGLVTGTVDYSLLAGPYGTRVGVSYSRLDYQYSFLKNRFTGYSDSWEVRLSHPLVRTAGAQVNVKAAAGQTWLTDKYPTLFAFTGTEGRKKLNTGVLGMSGSLAMVPGGVSSVGADISFGDITYRDNAARFWSGSDLRDTEGTFTRLNYHLQHEQHIADPVSLMARVNGQMTDKNLDASQKFLLGGPSAVRAYDVGSGSVDTGAVMTGEVRTQWQLPAMPWVGSSPFVTAAGFYDHGLGEQNRNNTHQSMKLTSDNQVNLSGAGMYVTVGDTGNYAVTATWAHNTGGRDPVSGNRDSDRFWLSAIKTF